MVSDPTLASDVPGLLRRLRAELLAHADPAFRASVARFFREPVRAYGVRTPQLRRIARAAWPEVRGWPLAARNRLCDELWKSGVLEEGAVAVEIYGAFRGSCGRCEFQLASRWIDRWVSNWGHCDSICAGLLAPAIANQPALARELPVWTTSASRWKRRAAAVALVWEARRGRHVPLALEIAGRLLEDPDDLVRKGVGWLLKEAYTASPRQVLPFLEANRRRTPRLVLRIAAEKMDAAARRRVLA